MSEKASLSMSWTWCHGRFVIGMLSPHSRFHVDPMDVSRDYTYKDCEWRYISEGVLAPFLDNFGEPWLYEFDGINMARKNEDKLRMLESVESIHDCVAAKKVTNFRRGL